LRVATSRHAAGLAAAATLLVGACGANTGPTASVAPVASTAAPSGALASSAPPGESPAASLRTGSGFSVEADPGLLAFIPGGGNGLDMTYDAETTKEVAADPALAKDAVGLAIALFTATGASTPASDLAIVSVVHLRDPSIGDEAFRSWRDSYDVSACAAAGGVTGHAQVAMNGGTVYIGSCGGGVLTYHVRLRQGAIVVSTTSIGPKRLGEKVMEAIEP
jgi:hypothetical protein